MADWYFPRQRCATPVVPQSIPSSNFTPFTIDGHTNSYTILEWGVVETAPTTRSEPDTSSNFTPFTFDGHTILEWGIVDTAPTTRSSSESQRAAAQSTPVLLEPDTSHILQSEEDETPTTPTSTPETAEHASRVLSRSQSPPHLDDVPLSQDANYNVDHQDTEEQAADDEEEERDRQEKRKDEKEEREDCAEAALDAKQPPDPICHGCRDSKKKPGGPCGWLWARCRTCKTVLCTGYFLLYFPNTFFPDTQRSPRPDHKYVLKSETDISPCPICEGECPCKKCSNHYRRSKFKRDPDPEDAEEYPCSLMWSRQHYRAIRKKERVQRKVERAKRASARNERKRMRDLLAERRAEQIKKTIQSSARDKRHRRREGRDTDDELGSAPHANPTPRKKRRLEPSSRAKNPPRGPPRTRRAAKSTQARSSTPVPSHTTPNPNAGRTFRYGAQDDLMQTPGAGSSRLR